MGAYSYNTEEEAWALPRVAMIVVAALVALALVLTASIGGNASAASPSVEGAAPSSVVLEAKPTDGADRIGHVDRVSRAARVSRVGQVSPVSRVDTVSRAGMTVTGTQQVEGAQSGYGFCTWAVVGAIYGLGAATIGWMVWAFPGGAIIAGRYFGANVLRMVARVMSSTSAVYGVVAAYIC